MEKLKLEEVIKDQAAIAEKKDLIERDVQKRLSELGKTSSVTIISGLRRCGKSTLMDSVRKHRDGYYLNFDDERLVGFEVDDFQKAYDLFLELYGEKETFYFDEIQNVEGWELFVRRLRDREMKVYVTGSNASMLSRELGTRLTGRYLQLTLYPFSFREFLRFRGASEKGDTSIEKSRIKRHFFEYLRAGGIPEYLRTGDKEYLKTLYENIIYRDVLVRYNLDKEKVLRELVNYVASNISKEISYNSLKKTLGLGNATTVKEYLGHLENSFLVFQVPKMSQSYKKQIYANKKVYMIDNAIAINVGYRLSEDRGRLLENMVLIELKRRGKDVCYHRGERECDFVVRDKKEAYQVCYELGEKNREREIGGLLEAMGAIGTKEGTILTYDQKEELSVDGKAIKVRPVWEWSLE